MGGQTFEVTRPETDVAAAFAAARDEALWEYGHRGYTGTIAEKDGYHVFDDAPDGTPVEKVTEQVDIALGQWYPPYGQPDAKRPGVEPWFEGSAGSQAASVYDDKWGPALAIPVPGGGWHFCGWASC